MDATIDILEAKRLGEWEKWVDDAVGIRKPIGKAGGKWVYAFNIQDIFKATKPLGVPWKASKCLDFGFDVKYLGFLWNLPEKRVSLPDEKRLKYLARIEAFLVKVKSNVPVTQEACMLINGTLSHITFIYPQGRAYLPSLSAFISTSHDQPSARLHAQHSIRSDMAWWVHTLRQPKLSRSLKSRVLRKLDVAANASTSWGIGVTIGNLFDAWKLAKGWKAGSRDVSWVEMIAVELAIRHVEHMGIADCDVRIHCANQGVISTFARGRSRNHQVNNSIRRADVIGMARNIHFILEYVRSERNPADPVSRGVPGRHLSRLPSIVLPKYLTSLLIHA